TASTPPAAATGWAQCSTMRRRHPTPGDPVEPTSSTEALARAGGAAPNSAAGGPAAVALDAAVPAYPPTGDPMTGPRPGKAGWPVPAALSEYGFGSVLPGGTPIRTKG